MQDKASIINLKDKSNKIKLHGSRVHLLEVNYPTPTLCV